MQNHWDLGRWGRIPVTMDWTVLLTFAWLYLWMRDLLGALIGSLALFALFAAHEFGHVLAARWFKVPVYGINFNGLHGETARGHARSRRDEALIAWGGVAAQLLVLLLALPMYALLNALHSRWVGIVAGPMLMVWTQWNVFLIIVALLPIGPMDGHAAWKIIGVVRESLRRPKEYEKVVKLDPARRRALEEDSARKASEIIERLGKK